MTQSKPDSQEYLKDLDKELETHFKIMKSCSVETDAGETVLLATKPEARYPYFYPRDVACASGLLAYLSTSEFSVANDAYKLLESVATFVLKIIRDDGYLGQRYALSGEEKSIYKQEDNNAHGMIILSNYLLTAKKNGENIQNTDGFLLSINNAALYAIKNFYRSEINLFHSTTSIHESALEEGFSCWTNFAYLKAFHLVTEVNSKLDASDIIPDKILTFKSAFKHNLFGIMISNKRFLRRIDQKGNYDFKPDFTLLSPFYFGFGGEAKDYIDNSVSFLERQLWDPELGMIQRYLPFSGDIEIHTHAGNGPWLQYTAILAQYHYWCENIKLGDELIGLIDNYRNEKGEIPEHISTCKRFDRFIESEWKTGIDFDKEFDKHILQDNLDFDKILEETNNMQRAYKEVAAKCMIPDVTMEEGGYILFVTPLMWSHVEYMKALLYKHGLYSNDNPHQSR
jgi:GH15 family glucan-1,4-alpha-glucosidase